MRYGRGFVRYGTCMFGTETLTEFGSGDRHTGHARGGMSACLTDARLRIANASSPLGAFPMAVLAGEDLVSREIARRGFWEIRSPAQLLASEPSAALPATPPQ